MRLTRLLFGIVLLLSKSLCSQTLKGYVRDSEGMPVAYATVSLLLINDSSIINYTIVNEDGRYKLNSTKEGEFIMKVTSLGYYPHTENIIIQKSQQLERNITLKDNPKMLQDVIVKGIYKGVKYVRDTIKYDTKAFTDGSEIVLGDVLNKLPGIEVDAKGNVKAQGKEVSKILLDGQDYFANNPQMATKNLAADLAETVEVLNNYSEFSILSGFQSNEQTVINVGVNKSKYGKISGNMLLGGGYKNKYSTSANLMQLRSKSMISFIEAANNTGDQVFSTDDYFRLQGGINEVIGKTGKFELSEEERRLLFPQNNTYKKINGLSALNFSYQPKPTLKMNSYLLFNANKASSEDLNSYRYFLHNQQTLAATENVKAQNRNNLTSGYLKLEYSPSKTLSIGYKGSVSNSAIKENKSFNSMMENKLSFSKEYRNIKPMRTNHQLMLMNAWGKNVFLMNIKFAYSNIPLKLDLTTDTLLLPVPFEVTDGLYYGRQEVQTNKMNSEVSASLFYRINKNYFLQPQIGFNGDYQKIKTRVYSGINRLFIKDDSLINNQTVANNDFFATLSLIKNRGLFRFKLGMGVHYLHQNGNIKNRINENNTVQFTPSTEFSLVFSPKHRLNTTFSKSVSSNDVDYFMDNISIDSYKSYKLKSLINRFYSHKYQIGLNYNFFDSFSDITLILMGVYEREKNRITTNYIQNGIISKAQYVASPPTQNIWSNLYLSKGLGFIPWRLTANGTITRKLFYNYLLGNENKIKSNKYTSNLKLQSNYHFPLNTELFAEIEHINNNASITQNVMFNVQRYGGKLKYKANKEIYMEAELQYMKNHLPSYNQELYQLNAFIKYDLSKKISLQLRANNILHLRKMDWSSVSYTQNYEVEQKYRQIPGNLLLSLKCNL